MRQLTLLLTGSPVYLNESFKESKTEEEKKAQSPTKSSLFCSVFNCCTKSDNIDPETGIAAL